MPKDNEAPAEVIQGDIDRAAKLRLEACPTGSSSRMFEEIAAEHFARHRLAYQSEAPAQGEAWSRLDFAIRSILPGSADDGEYKTASGRWAKVREADLLRLAAAYRAANGSRPAPSLPLADREAIARVEGHDAQIAMGMIMEADDLDAAKAIAGSFLEGRS